MNNNWKFTKLKDVCTFNKTSITPESGTVYSHYSFPAYDTSKKPEIEDGNDINSSKFLIKEGDILFNKLNVRFKRIWDINKYPGDNAICSTEFIIIQAKKIDRNYLLCLLNSYEFTKEMIFRSTGTSNSHQRINVNDIKDFEFKLPPKNIQKIIGNYIKIFNKKIAISQEINNNLEQLSNNIFRQYFISYEFPDKEGKPYKSNGGKFITTEYGEIPEKWNIINLKEICKFVKGKKPKIIEEKYFKDSKEYLTIDVLQGKEKLYCSKEKTIPIEKYDILMVMDGASSGELFYGKNGILGSTLAKIQVEEKYLEIIYKYLDYYNEEIKRNNTGSAIPHTDKGFVLNLQIAVPNDLNNINTIFRTIRDETIKNNQEIDRLTKLRDTILPKLMSGEIDVSEINFDLETEK